MCTDTPRGHTKYSWGLSSVKHRYAAGRPPGHTAYSWGEDTKAPLSVCQGTDEAADERATVALLLARLDALETTHNSESRRLAAATIAVEVALRSASAAAAAEIRAPRGGMSALASCAASHDSLDHGVASTAVAGDGIPSRAIRSASLDKAPAPVTSAHTPSALELPAVNEAGEVDTVEAVAIATEVAQAVTPEPEVACSVNQKKEPTKAPSKFCATDKAGPNKPVPPEAAKCSTGIMAFLKKWF